MVRRWVYCQRPRNGGLGLPDQENHCSAERLVYFDRSLSKDTVWGRKVAMYFLDLSPTPKLKVNVSFRAKHRLFANSVRPYATFLGPVTFLGHERNCIEN